MTAIIEHSSYQEDGTNFNPGPLGPDGLPFVLVKRREDVTPATEETPESYQTVYEVYSGRHYPTDYSGKAAWLREVAEVFSTRAAELDILAEA